MEGIRLEINGKKHVVDVSPYKPLRDVLRYDVGLTGTKESCDSGVCGVGACVVYVRVRCACVCGVLILKGAS